jgi:toxin YoeB
MKLAFLTDAAFDAFNEWALSDKKIYKKLLRLIKEIKRTPFSGLGKPEPLKHELSGYWSREITDTHRLVYRINGEFLEILTCKYHYKA